MRYLINTYGCQMNVHESEKIAGILKKMGYLPCDRSEDADVIVFNTCCVRENAEQHAYGNIGMLKKLKKERPDLVICVCGCMTQQGDFARENLWRRNNRNPVEREAQTIVFRDFDETPFGCVSVLVTGR